MKGFVKLLRLPQWIKNGFVLLGVIFSPHLVTSSLLVQAFLTTLAFCFASSSAYVLNDIFDVDRDQMHPIKKSRPIASGVVSIQAGWIFSLCLASLSLLIGYLVNIKVEVMLILYLALNILYSFWWKQVVILDVFCISAGFMLRIIAGTYGLGIPPSKWLLLCGLMVTLFLGFAKRRAELISCDNHRITEDSRIVLEQYGRRVLDRLIAICAAGVIMTYSLYTMSETTIRIHHTENLIYTVPPVIYGLFRYIFLLYRRHSGENPAQDVFRDFHILGAVFCWGTLTLIFLICRDCK